MSGFVKFPSIQQNWIVPAFAHEGFHESRFVVTEKLDGANIQLYFEKSRPWRVGKRTGFVKRRADFFNLWPVLDRYSSAIDKLAKYASRANIRLRVYGELFGSEVIARIDYRTPGDVRFFAIDRNDERLSFAAMERLLGELDLVHLLVPVRCRVTFGEALALEPACPSLLNPDVNAEGFVVSGEENTFANPRGVPFLCKVKNPLFADVEGGNSDNPEYYPITAYINRNRLCSVASKHGDFDNLRYLDRYVDWVIEEVMADYVRDHGSDPDVPAERFRKQILTLVVEYVKGRKLAS